MMTKKVLGAALLAILLFVGVRLFQGEGPPAPHSGIIARNEPRPPSPPSPVVPPLPQQGTASPLPLTLGSPRPATPRTVSASLSLSETTRTELRNCGLLAKQGWADTDLVTLDSVQAFLNRKLGAMKKESMNWKNLHFTSRDGEKKRIRLTRESWNDNKPKVRMQLYTLDAEDLPVPVQIPEEDAGAPGQATIERYIDGGEITEQQDSTHFTFAGGAEIDLERRDGHIRSLHLVSQDARFQCVTDPSDTNVDCKCFGNPSR